MRLASKNEILANATDTVEGKFATLGSSLTYLGDQVNWQWDFKSGKTWPLLYYKDIPYFDTADNSDVKVPWELSRFHQAAWLGRAYWLTNDESYAVKFRSLVEDWITKNPLPYGVNWLNAMEAAIRAANWILAYLYFERSPALNGEFQLKLFESLLWHGEYISWNLEYGRRNGNHLLSDATGLFVLGLFFR
ncbi:MAG: heparinase II/III family protein, partial [Armatimonadota bacterium]